MICNAHCRWNSMKAGGIELGLIFRRLAQQCVLRIVADLASPLCQILAGASEKGLSHPGREQGATCFSNWVGKIEKQHAMIKLQTICKHSIIKLQANIADVFFRLGNSGSGGRRINLSKCTKNQAKRGNVTLTIAFHENEINFNESLKKLLSAKKTFLTLSMVTLHFFTLHLCNPHFLGSDGPDSMGSYLPHILR